MTMKIHDNTKRTINNCMRLLPSASTNKQLNLSYLKRFTKVEENINNCDTKVDI